MNFTPFLHNPSAGLPTVCASSSAKMLEAGLRGRLHTATTRWRLPAVAAIANPSRALMRSFQFGSHRTVLILNSETGEVDERITPGGEGAGENNPPFLATTDTVIASRVMDPAIVIGQVISDVRNANCIDPDRFDQALQPLRRLAGQGNLSCRIVLDWVETRRAGTSVSEKP